MTNLYTVHYRYYHRAYVMYTEYDTYGKVLNHEIIIAVACFNLGKKSQF